MDQTTIIDLIKKELKVAKQTGRGAPKSFHTRNEHAIIKAMNAEKQGQGIDAVDQKGLPFEIRESRKTPKFRLQKDIHDELCRRNGYYLFKRGDEITKNSNRIGGKALSLVARAPPRLENTSGAAQKISESAARVFVAAQCVWGAHRR